MALLLLRAPPPLLRLEWSWVCSIDSLFNDMLALVFDAALESREDLVGVMRLRLTCKRFYDQLERMGFKKYGEWNHAKPRPWWTCCLNLKRVVAADWLPRFLLCREYLYSDSPDACFRNEPIHGSVNALRVISTARDTQNNTLALQVLALDDTEPRVFGHMRLMAWPTSDKTVEAALLRHCHCPLCEATDDDGQFLVCVRVECIYRHTYRGAEVKHVAHVHPSWLDVVGIVKKVKENQLVIILDKELKSMESACNHCSELHRHEAWGLRHQYTKCIYQIPDQYGDLCVKVLGDVLCPRYMIPVTAASAEEQLLFNQGLPVET